MDFHIGDALLKRRYMGNSILTKTNYKGQKTIN